MLQIFPFTPDYRNFSQNLPLLKSEIMITLDSRKFCGKMVRVRYHNLRTVEIKPNLFLPFQHV